jgi:hypothetical protein
MRRLPHIDPYTSLSTGKHPAMLATTTTTTTTTTQKQNNAAQPIPLTSLLPYLSLSLSLSLSLAESVCRLSIHTTPRYHHSQTQHSNNQHVDSIRFDSIRFHFITSIKHPYLPQTPISVLTNRSIDRSIDPKPLPDASNSNSNSAQTPRRKAESAARREGTTATARRTANKKRKKRKRIDVEGIIPFKNDATTAAQHIATTSTSSTRES